MRPLVFGSRLTAGLALSSFMQQLYQTLALDFLVKLNNNIDELPIINLIRSLSQLHENSKNRNDFIIASTSD